MCIISRWKLRDVTSTVTLQLYIFLSRVSGTCTRSQEGVQKGPPDLTGGFQTGKEAQHGSAGYSYSITIYSKYDVK